MYGHHEDITKVTLMLTKPSQVIPGAREFIHPLCVCNLASNLHKEYATY